MKEVALFLGDERRYETETLLQNIDCRQGTADCDSWSSSFYLAYRELGGRGEHILGKPLLIVMCKQEKIYFSEGLCDLRLTEAQMTLTTPTFL